MILFGDYHTHTIYTGKRHAKGTILDNAKVAADKGLKQIAVTDHGYGHRMFACKRKDIPQIKEDILAAKDITGVDILLGVESNLISCNGDIDIRDEDYEFLDILLMGFHTMAKPYSWKDNVKMFWPNYFAKGFEPSKERLNRNTTAYLKALDKYPIDVITHLNHACPVDTMAVARLAKQKGTFVELNGKRINMTDKELCLMAEEGVKFIINSDAHTSDKVGECNNGLNTIFRLGIPLSQVVNVDKLPKFKNKGRFEIN